MLPHHICCAFHVSAATSTAFCEALIFLELAESRYVHLVPANFCFRTFLISLCIVQHQTFCAARSLVILCLSMNSGPGPGKFSGF